MGSGASRSHRALFTTMELGENSILDLWALPSAEPLGLAGPLCYSPRLPGTGQAAAFVRTGPGDLAVDRGRGNALGQALDQVGTICRGRQASIRREQTPTPRC